MTKLVKNTGKFTHRVLIGTPSLGNVRIEWHNAMCGLVIPCNWSNSTQTPIGFQVADAQNLLVQEVIEKSFEWLLLIEDDVVVPANLFIILSQYMEDCKYPIVSGLYNLKGNSSEPLLYRGRGNGAFKGFKRGDRVFVDGVPTGCLIIHYSILLLMWESSEKYFLSANQTKLQIRRVFETPRKVFTDIGANTYQKLIGTSDIYFCDRILNEDILKKAGWKELSKQKYPFLCDTAIQCGHIDRETGVIY